MKAILIVGIIATSVIAAKAQQQQLNIQPQLVAATVHMPPMQSISVEEVQAKDIVFSSVDDYNKGIMIPQFCRITVISNIPWVVSVKAIDGYMQHIGSGSYKDMPVNVVQLKSYNMPKYVPLSTTETLLFPNNNKKIVNSYDMDLKVNPGWNYQGANYTTSLIFTLSPY